MKLVFIFSVVLFLVATPRFSCKFENGSVTQVSFFYELGP